MFVMKENVNERSGFVRLNDVQAEVVTEMHYIMHQYISQ